MKKSLLWCRCVVEWVIGGYMLLAGLVQATSTSFALHSNTLAYRLGRVGGAVIIAALGFKIFQDALRLRKRLRNQQPAAISN